MKNALILVLLALSLSSGAQSSKYWVFFTDKEGVEFNPYEYFDAKAITRREKLGLSLTDITDYPVSPSYISEVELMVDSTSHHTRWFNALAVYASLEQIEFVKGLPFVKEVSEFPNQPMELLEEMDDDYLYGSEREMMEAQTNRMGRQDFARQKINGKGIRIAVLDAGFSAVDTHPMFHHIRSRNGILATYDFVKNKEGAYHGHFHGTCVLSCIAGVYRDEITLIKDTFGLATGAEFLLARTEKRLIEVMSEEENWLAAVEWADKNGADIINSSLGYGAQRYSYPDMNGQNTLVTRAGNLAAKKGILVVNSAGNEGNIAWNYINAPADADSVLAVGGLNPWTGIQTSFSSVGPSYDRDIKPNVTALAHVMAAEKDYLVETQGTSFSSPLVAGFAACAWQANPEWSNMDLFHNLEQGADLYPYYDYAHGYGVPMAEKFLPKDSSEVFIDTTFTWSISDGEIEIRILEPSEIERNDLSEFFMADLDSSKAVLNYEDYVFIHFKNEKDQVTHYQVIDMLNAEVLFVDIPYNTKSIMCFYEGYIEEKKIK